MRLGNCAFFCFIFFLASCRSENEAGGSDAAIKIAKEEIISLSARMENHVPIDAGKVAVEAVERIDDGWNVTLKEEGCVYIVYVNPGKEVDVAGKNAACQRGPKGK